MNIVFIVEGGIGKVIMSTVVCRAIKKKYPDSKLITASGYPWVYDTNLNVDRALMMGMETKYIYDDYVKGGKGLVFKKEPYLEYDYMTQKKHLTQVWCELFNLPFDTSKPELFLTDMDLKNVEDFVKKKDKPVLLLHLKGGAIPKKEGEPTPKMYPRDLPNKTAQLLAKELKNKYHILNVGGQWNKIEDTEMVMGQDTLRDIMGFCLFADKMIFIDSFMQHACAALGKQALVLWGATSPANLGYETNINLTKSVCPDPHCGRPNSFVFDRQLCLHNEGCLNYSVEEILEKL